MNSPEKSEACETASRRDQLDDDRLGQLLRASPLPAPAGNTAVRVRQRLRRRRLRRSGGVLAVAAAVLLLVGFLSWPGTQPGKETEPVAGLPVTPMTMNRPDELPEADLLFGPPPVDPLNHVTRQQDGYLVVMARLRKE